MQWSALPPHWMAFGVIAVACSGSPGPVPGLPADARAITSDEIPDEALARLGGVHGDDELFLLETPGGSVLIRARQDDPPRMLASSCDVLTSVELPAEWDGWCLEYTWDGRRVTGVFPHGTRSVTSTDLGHAQTPEKAAAAAASLIVPAVEFAPVGEIVHIPSGGPADFRVQVNQHGFCQWFGVSGAGDAWRASPALACTDPSR